MQDFIRIHEEDNVAVALRPIAAGEQLTVGEYQVTTQEEIPQGHKFALKAIAEGEPVIKYGFRIGYAKEAIAAGENTSSGARCTVTIFPPGSPNSSAVYSISPIRAMGTLRHIKKPSPVSSWLGLMV